MKLRTNYSKNDWYRLIATYSIFVALVGPMIYLLVDYFLIPSIEFVDIIAKFINTDGNEAWKTYFQNYIESELNTDEKISHFVISLPFVLLGSVYAFLIGFIFFVNKVTGFPFWICRKIGINPKMNLVVIKNEKFWFRLKV